jgi:hypothetical protein
MFVALMGCGLQESQAEKRSRQIAEWVPYKTSLESARRAMEQQHFTCSVVSYDNAEQMSNNIDAHLWRTIVVRDDQRFAVTNVTHLDCKKPQCHITFALVNGQVTGYTFFGRL